jgi:hypothetical protein
MLFHPRIDGGIAEDGTVEPQQLPSHRRSIFTFGSMLRGTPTRGTKGTGPQNALLTERRIDHPMPICIPDPLACIGDRRMPGGDFDCP